jgi:two-component system OmpR family response regulator
MILARCRKIEVVGAPSALGGLRGESITLLLVGTPARDTDELLKAFANSGMGASRSHDPDEIAHSVTMQRPNVVVVDLRNDDPLSRRMLEWICRKAATGALVITDLTQVETRLQVLEMDCVIDHLIAPFDPREGTARVRALLALRSRGNPLRIDAGDLQVDVAQRVVERRGERVPLTPRELDLLLLLIENTDTPVPKREILDRIWGGQAHSENVVEANVSSLRRKLHAIGPPVIYTVHRSGYVFRSVSLSSTISREVLLEERDRLVRERQEMVAHRDEIIRRLRAERDQRR